MSVSLLDRNCRSTGETLDDWEAAKLIACLLQRVNDLEGEMLRRGFDEQTSYYRADQHCVCVSCGKYYRDHPYGGPLTYERSLILHRLCNGELVKL